MADRFGTRGRWQPSGCGLPGGNNGSICAQSSSGMRHPSSWLIKPMTCPPNRFPVLD
ncbi:hypothetical protein FHR94_003696 [Halomonas cerina]|uniref:Uncharacterized protein n=1 Tax=Halomonas cerina TaxID=447424 RepID=A0A839VE54_9GAMM|nr:hypothetical protein [Halomonas cerina]